MSNLAPEKVLRINCPGWGVSSTLPLGEAKPLAMYDVIVINPTSIIHLFEPESAAVKQVDHLLQDGLPFLKLESDSTLESIGAELELREDELRKFLSKGGLLVYFLAAPFTVSGPSVHMDNYSWLYEYCPDKVDGKARTMTPGKGKDLKVLARGKQHVFGAYLQQAGMELSAHVRAENLAEGYKSLAKCGFEKCVAAYKISGPKRGQIVFLPAPYETRYDEVLKECILNWHDLHTGPDADKPEAEPANEEDDEPDIEGRALLNDLLADDSEPNKNTTVYAQPAASSTSSDFDSLYAMFENISESADSASKPPALDNNGDKNNSSDKTTKYADDDLLKSFVESPTEKGNISALSASSSNLFDAPSVSLFDEPAPSAKAKKNNIESSGLAENVPPISKELEKENELARSKAAAMQRELELARQEEEKELERTKAAAMIRELELARQEEQELKNTVPQSQVLMSRMEQEISNPGVPEWCQKISFSELKQLQFELDDLNEKVRSARQTICKIEDQIRNFGELKDALLSLSGMRLTQACCKVFESLGWSVKISETSSAEVWLRDGDKTQAIVRIVFFPAQPNRAELAELAESVITYWGNHDEEPKGILAASTFAEKPPEDRTEEDFTGSMGEFAKRKNLLLLTSQQLLAIYREVLINKADGRKIRENLLSNSGILPGFKLELFDAARAESATK